MTLSTSDLIDALRIREVQIDRATIASNPKMILIGGNAITADGAATPIELSLTPVQAGGLLALLTGLHQAGHIPQPQGQLTRHRNQ